jgi:hypothetical protein
VYLRRCDRPEDIARHKEDGTNQKDGGCATHRVSPFSSCRQLFFSRRQTSSSVKAVIISPPKH